MLFEFLECLGSSLQQEASFGREERHGQLNQMWQGTDGPGNNHVKAMGGLLVDRLARLQYFYSGSNAIDILQMQISAELP